MSYQWIEIGCSHCDEYIEVEIEIGPGIDTISLQCPACGEYTDAFVSSGEDEVIGSGILLAILVWILILIVACQASAREPIVAELQEAETAANNKAAFDTAVARMSNYDTLVVKPGIYSIDPVTISGLDSINIRAEGAAFSGTLAAGPLITIQDCESVNASIGTILYTTRNWSVDSIGLRLHGIKKADIEIGSIIYATRGVHFYTDSCFIANQNIALRAFLIRDASKGISVQNTSGGWNNECVIRDTFIYLTPAVKSAESAGHCVHFDTAGAHTYDNWVFDAVKCEDGFTGIEMQGGHGFEFRNCRFEDVDSYWYQNPGNGCKISLGVGSLPDEKISISTNSDGLVITGNTGTDFIGIVQDYETGGITWLTKQTGEKQTFFSNPASRQGLKMVDYAGQVHVFNQSQQAAAIPSAGNYAVGARIQNTNSSCGQPIFWQCTVSGTMGALDGVTGTASSGSRYVDLTFAGSSDIDDVKTIGTLIMIGADVRTVLYATDSDTIYIDTGVSTDHTDATVQFRNASWKAGPMFP